MAAFWWFGVMFLTLLVTARWWWQTLHAGKFFLSPLILLTIVALSPFYYEYPDTGASVPISFQGAEIVPHPYGMFSWEWGHDWTNMPLPSAIGYGLKLTAQSRVTPITDNPKVRTISYHVQVAIHDPNLWYRLPERRVASTTEFAGVTTYDMVVGVVDYQLYEFNDKYKKVGHNHSQQEKQP